jgi:hypothetical protein
VSFGHERCGFFACEFFVCFVEFGVTVDFAERLLQDFYVIPRRTRRQDKGRAGMSESTLKLHELALSHRAGHILCPGVWRS